jgi:hypothetical protein
VGALTVLVLLQYVEVRERMEAIVLNHSTPDAMIWHWCSSGLYSVRSAYSTMFIGQSELQGAWYLWKVKALAEFKFFFWLALQGRCWTSECLHRRGLASDASCALFSKAEESTDHLLLGCVFTTEVWARMLQPLGWQDLVPTVDSILGIWWVDARKKTAKPRRHAFDSLVMLVTRLVWLEQNDRVFNRNHSSLVQLCHRVLSSA